MQKEKVTDKEAICLFVLFIYGSSLIIGIGGGAENDSWLAAIVGTIMAVPVMLIYSRILSIYEGKDLFDILEILFGKFIGKIIAVIYVWYSFHLGALVLRNFGEFLNTIAMPETPMIASLLFMGIVCIIGVSYGVEVLCRTCTYFIPLIIFILAFVELLGLPKFNLEYIKPVLGNGLNPVLQGGFSAFSFPYAETVVFMGAFASLKTKKSPFRVYLLGILISSPIIIVNTLRNVLILGNTLSSFYFPSYGAVSMIRFGEYIERIEVTLAVTFTFCIFVKCSVCLLTACMGFGKILNLKNYRTVVIQTGLLMIYFSYIVYDNTMEMKYWAFKVYPYYAFIFQVIIPVIIWVFAEIKVRKNR